MSSAAVVFFFQDGSYRDGSYRVLFELFRRHMPLWRNELDDVYVVDSGWELTYPDLTFLANHHCHVLSWGRNTHWYNCQQAMDSIPHEWVLLLDSDTLVYSADVVRDSLAKLNRYDFVSLMDGTGKVDAPGEFPWMGPDENRATRRRMTPYLCFARRRWLTGKSFDPELPLYDSMGKISIEAIRAGANVYELEDDRNSLLMGDDNIWFRTTNLDGPPYAWSAPITKIKQLGYYHIRNWSAGTRIIHNWRTGKEAYDRDVVMMPRWEFLRLVGWVQIAAMLSGYRVDEFCTVIEQIAADRGIPADLWRNYIEGWFEYHPWLKDLRC